MLFKSIPKGPGETLDFRFDWGSAVRGQPPYLEPGETIADYSITADPGITVTEHQIVEAGRAVVVWLAGGTVGQTYEVLCSITTNVSRTAERTMSVPVQRK